MQTIDLDILRLEDGHRILDLGCGRGRHTHAAYFHRRCHSVGLDLGLEDVLTTQSGFLENPDLEPQTGHARRYDLMVGDALSLPFPDNYFDRLICSEVLEHIPDYGGALAEIWRITKPGGHIGISVPNRWPEQICWLLSRDYYDTPGGHVRIFKRRVLQYNIEAMGFKYLTRHLTHGLHSPYWWLKCAVGVDNNDHFLVRRYRRMLEAEILHSPPALRLLSRLADPLMGKSLVMYFYKPENA